MAVNLQSLCHRDNLAMNGLRSWQPNKVLAAKVIMALFYSLLWGKNLILRLLEEKKKKHLSNWISVVLFGFFFFNKSKNLKKAKKNFIFLKVSIEEQVSWNKFLIVYIFCFLFSG